MASMALILVLYGVPHEMLITDCVLTSEYFGEEFMANPC